ncbi:Lrp/AsnC family transcriptional regulator [Amycolatopsis jejuensis]|uniref:Lrp/AsnC family transcriptional regulator n=1 Tax=Amycolatopsis jejuensis TaxID=330084 RepID=UPI000A7071AB|nr:Lrp/AsnC family transcriptional regulator [Amycolatopsis jejuensis]
MDAIDRRILDLLREDARRTVRDIADHVGLTVAPVKRRIDRLEATGVIDGYTVRINPARIGPDLEAVVELRVAGNMDLETILSFSSHVPEVTEVLTLAGDPDALIRVRARTIHELQRVVNVLRTSDKVAGTKTLVVLGTWAKGK